MLCILIGQIFGSPSLRRDAAGFSVEDSVVFPWDQGLSRVPVGNSGRVLTVGIRALGFRIPKGLCIAVHPIRNFLFLNRTKVLFVSKIFVVLQNLRR